MSIAHFDSSLRRRVTGDYDLAGFAVGVVERQSILPRRDIMAGDVLLGLSASGPHSNGFSLIRKVVSKVGLSYFSPCPWDEQLSLGRALLEPTKIYIKQVLPAVHANLIKGMSHITGGGFVENIPRVLPQGVGCYVDVSTWSLPPLWQFIMKSGGVEPLEMARTFNNGIGLVIIVDRHEVDKAIKTLEATGDSKVYQIGKVVEGHGVEMRNLQQWDLVMKQL